MNKIDDYEWLANFRAETPFPSQAQLANGQARLLAAVTCQGRAPRRQRAAYGPFQRWRRPMVALAAATTIAVGAGFALTAPTAKSMKAGQAAQQAILAAKVLRIAAARVDRDAAIAEPSPGQWIYYTEVDESGAKSAPTSEGPEWVTFDGGQSAYYEVGGPFIVHTSSTSFPPRGTNPWVALNAYGISAKTAWDVLAALPDDPRALLAVIAHQVATPVGEQFAAASVTSFMGGAETTKAQLEFDYLTRILWNARLGGPPAALAAVYRAMATLPGITIQRAITDAAGAPAVGVSDDGGYNQLLLSPVTYQVVGWRVISYGTVPRRGRAPLAPKGSTILSTALTQVTEVAGPGVR
jgi:hypothetical protein